jgi:hypothetical protein
MPNELEHPAASPQQIQGAMRDMRDRVRAWWKRDGLGHTSAVSMSEGGSLDLELNCSLYFEMEERMHLQDPALPEAERRAQVQRYFEGLGFVLYCAPGDDVAVRDCDESSQALRKIIKDTFPSSIVRSIESRGARDGTFVLQSAQLLIRDLADVFSLPAARPDA